MTILAQKNPPDHSALWIVRCHTDHKPALDTGIELEKLSKLNSADAP